MDKDTDLKVLGKKGAPNMWLNFKDYKMLYLVGGNRSPKMFEIFKPSIDDFSIDNV